MENKELKQKSEIQQDYSPKLSNSDEKLKELIDGIKYLIKAMILTIGTILIIPIAFFSLKFLSFVSNYNQFDDINYQVARNLMLDNQKPEKILGLHYKISQPLERWEIFPDYSVCVESYYLMPKSINQVYLNQDFEQPHLLKNNVFMPCSDSATYLSEFHYGHPMGMGWRDFVPTRTYIHGGKDYNNGSIWVHGSLKNVELARLEGKVEHIWIKKDMPKHTAQAVIFYPEQQVMKVVNWCDDAYLSCLF